MAEPVAGFHPDNLDLIRRWVQPRFRENLVDKDANADGTTWDDDGDEFDLVTGNITLPGQVIVSGTTDFFVQLDASVSDPTNKGTKLVADVNHVLSAYGATKLHYLSNGATSVISVTVEGD